MAGKTFSNNLISILADIFNSNIKLLDQEEITHHTNHCNWKTEDEINFM